MSRVVEMEPDRARNHLRKAGAEFMEGSEGERWRARHGGGVVACHDNGVVIYGNAERMEKLLTDGGGVTLYFDGASRGNPGPSAIAYVISDDGVVKKNHERIGVATNNEAEYRALIEGLREASDMGIDIVEAVGDSNLVVRQVSGDWSCNASNLKPLLNEVRDLEESFRSFHIRHVPREANMEADELANQALDK